MNTCFNCDEPIEDAEDMARCPACKERLNESASERSIEAFYGASTPQTDLERQGIY